jgi:bacterioferritin-associated ferredoxin
MKDFCTPQNCETCPGRIVCHCLQVTEEALLAALNVLDLRTVKQIGEAIGAGDGCTACHKELKRYLDLFAYYSSAEPDICSVR